ncbi:MAG: POTRA domain-containing protein, partial [Minicystis sp.]
MSALGLRPSRPSRLSPSPRSWVFLRVLLGLALLLRLLAAPRVARADDAGAPPAGDAPADVADAGAPPAPSVPPAAPPLATAQPVAQPMELPETGPQLAPTEAEKVRDQPIAKVVLAGNRRISSEDISGYLQQMRPGKLFTPEGLSKDVRELWDSGYFEDIEVDLNKKDDGVYLRILVRERPSIKIVEFSGNEKIDKDDLTESLSGEVKAGSILSYSALRRGVQKLRDKYAEEGYFLAEVSFEVVPQKDNQVTVKVTIREHEQVSVRRITFVGNSHLTDAELREVMITGQTNGFIDFGTGGPFRQDAFERDVLIINALYYDKGYLSVQVATPRVMLTPDRNGIEITLAITEGPRYKIRQLRLYEKDDDGREVEPLGGRRHLREMV